MSNSSEILSILEYMEKEKQIKREEMIESISSAIRNAAAKSMTGYNLKIDINPKTGNLKAWALQTVTDSVADNATQIHIDKAKLYKPDAKLGDVIEREVDLSDLGRIAAKNVYQSIIQKLRTIEKSRVFDAFKDSIGDIVPGTVRRREKGAYIVDLGLTAAILPKRECIPGENYEPGDRIRSLLLEIDNSPRGPEIILSRASFKFVKRLFELEVSEIAEKSVNIEAMAREPGYRTKIAVSASDSRIDPVGACVGAGGTRVKGIVKELNGEKIDIIKYSPDMETLLAECIKPAVAKNVSVDRENKRISFEVSKEDLSVVIGKGGSNIKLTSRLIGMKIDVREEENAEGTNFEQKAYRAFSSLAQVLTNLSAEEVALLTQNGITSLDLFEGVEVHDLVEMGLSEGKAMETLELVHNLK